MVQKDNTTDDAVFQERRDDAMEKNCITVTEMGERMGISRSMAYTLANSQGFYPAFRLGKRVLVSITALEKWLDEQTKLS